MEQYRGTTILAVRRGGIACCHRFALPLMLLVMFELSACSSLMSNPLARQQQLNAYITQPEPLLFYYPASLQPDEQLRILGIEDIAQPLVRSFPSGQATRGMLEQFIAGVPRFSENAARIVDPDGWDAIHLSPDTPVLFFHVTWKMNYQRLPPQFRMYRLQVGTIAKIIPLAQVMSRKGTLAASTAAWEGTCLYEAYDGEYFSVEEWLADGAVRLLHSVKAAQEACVQKLALDFSRTVSVGTGQ